MKQTSVTTNGPCWVELGTSDPAAAKAFYAELFGWRADTDVRPEAGGYTQMHLGDAPAAAVTPRYAPRQPTAWTVSFAVADADDTAARIKDGGGSLLVEPTDVFDLGRFAVAADPSGAVFTLWQPRAFPGAGVFNEPGSLGWVELLTRDPDGAIAFYPAVFGWSVAPSEHYTQWGLAGQDFGGMLAMGENFPPEVPPHWLPYFSVADVDNTAERAVALGADVLMPAYSMPGGRRIAVLRDAQGAAFGVYSAGTAG
ncbi:hydroxylase [Streptomyces rubellomurinus subsp. indigoferus]|uniref:Hydroxylase n=1 Tax=Streptomyces rubellomurinus (strain ATCC 31215) TaxID=359131 RepID=A0A0F2TCQ4_STRR3|nr:VOC family protein [Streptomyces rubellomurinus]KJS54710.1 hydroxylase [Streptomyces rubellomurinus subsp. indigoferus]KJS60291.1 hydroxylase [Streptomyces rubellomurinus]